jgi:hypothetical protein
VHAISATSTYLQDVWNIDPKLVRTRFNGSTIFHNHSIFFGNIYEIFMKEHGSKLIYMHGKHVD